MLSCNTFSDLDYRITKDEIKQAIRSFKCGKAIGLYRISSEMVKSSVTILIYVYEKLFNFILRSGIYPKSWHDSYICPIYQSRSRSDPSNYRGIAINNILGKVFSKQLQLLVLFCSSVPVVLFDTPGIPRCRSKHVSVESSSLLHHSIYLWFICFTWWSIDELENLHADRTTVCFEPW